MQCLLDCHSHWSASFEAAHIIWSNVSSEKMQMTQPFPLDLQLLDAKISSVTFSSSNMSGFCFARFQFNTACVLISSGLVILVAFQPFPNRWGVRAVKMRSPPVVLAFWTFSLLLPMSSSWELEFAAPSFEKEDIDCYHSHSTLGEAETKAMPCSWPTKRDQNPCFRTLYCWILRYVLFLRLKWYPFLTHLKDCMHAQLEAQIWTFGRLQIRLQSMALHLPRFTDGICQSCDHHLLSQAHESVQAQRLWTVYESGVLWWLDPRWLKWTPWRDVLSLHCPRSSCNPSSTGAGDWCGCSVREVAFRLRCKAGNDCR